MIIQLDIAQRMEFLKAYRRGFFSLDFLETMPQLKDAIQAYRTAQESEEIDFKEHLKRIKEYGEKHGLTYNPERAKAMFKRV